MNIKDKEVLTMQRFEKFFDQCDDCVFNGCGYVIEGTCEDCPVHQELGCGFKDCFCSQESKEEETSCPQFRKGEGYWL